VISLLLPFATTILGPSLSPSRPREASRSRRPLPFDASLEDPPPIPSLTNPIGRRRPIDATKDLLGAFPWASNSPLSSQQTNKPDNQAQVRLRPPSPCPTNTQLLELIARRAIHADTPTHSRLQRCDSRSRCRTGRPSQQDPRVANEATSSSTLCHNPSPRFALGDHQTTTCTPPHIANSLCACPAVS
jgi:hypothetical protein